MLAKMVFKPTENPKNWENKTEKKCLQIQPIRLIIQNIDELISICNKKIPLKYFLLS